MSKPLLTIVCTTYNHEKFITQTIEGFLLQKTNFPIEIIIHDDCSTDGTQNIIRSYADKFPELIKPIYQSKNQYSQGIKASTFIQPYCRGKYIAICEGDDYWVDPKKLQIQVDFLEANPDFVISSHDAFIVDESGNHIKDSKLPDAHKRNYSGEELILAKAWLLTMSWVYRNVIKDLAPERAKVTNGDIFFTSLIGHYGKSKYHAEIEPAAYRVHSGGVWSMKSEQDKLDLHTNTWFWMYHYYARIGQHDNACYYWNKFIPKVYSKLLIEEMGVIPFTSISNITFETQQKSAIEEYLIEQQKKIKQLEIHSKSSDNTIYNLKKSLSYRLGCTLLWPVKVFRNSVYYLIRMHSSK